jgi:hypothetical protein
VWSGASPLQLEVAHCSRLQKLAKSVFEFHTKELKAGEDFDAEKSGAEWWTLVLEAGDDVGLHWDRTLRPFVDLLRRR